MAPSLKNYFKATDFKTNCTESDVVEPESQLNQFMEGERWQVSVRLKRPHGKANPHDFDPESWALGESIRAMESIKSKAGIKKLDDFLWQPKVHF